MHWYEGGQYCPPLVLMGEMELGSEIVQKIRQHHMLEVKLEKVTVPPLMNGEKLLSPLL